MDVTSNFSEIFYSNISVMFQKYGLVWSVNGRTKFQVCLLVGFLVAPGLVGSRALNWIPWKSCNTRITAKYHNSQASPRANMS